MATSLCCFSTGRRDRTGALRCHQHLFRTAASVQSHIDAVTLRICKRARHSVHDGGLRQNDRARRLSGASAWKEGPSAHASPCPPSPPRDAKRGRFRNGQGHRSTVRTAVYMAMARISSGISGGSESSDYFLTNGFASVSGGRGCS
jgi:hypothetical protein